MGMGSFRTSVHCSTFLICISNRYCAHARVTNGHILLLKEAGCSTFGNVALNDWIDTQTKSNVFCIGSEAGKILIVELVHNLQH